jgi:hypothetical protein
MGTIPVRMHPDNKLEISRPADLLLTDPRRFEVTKVLRVQGRRKTEVVPGNADYPFENDDRKTSVLGFAEDKEGRRHPDRFRKQTPKLRGQQGDGLSGKEYELEWNGNPIGRGPHFKVFP